MKFPLLLAVVAAIVDASISAAYPLLSLEQYRSISVNSTVAPTDVSPLILGGTIVPPGSKTYTTGIRSTKSGTDFCGGSLITPNHVLTAAHCSRGDIKYVSVGTHYLSGSDDGEQIKVINQIKHPKNSAQTNAFDFLVLELETSSTFAPVALAAANESDSADNATATVLGWGVTTEGGSQSDELQRVDVPIVSNDACAKILDVDSSMICAGGVADKDSCKGDSGGPLILEGENEDLLIGVVSWGNGCGRVGYPGVYARVAKAREWLESVAPGAAFRSEGTQ